MNKLILISIILNFLILSAQAQYLSEDTPDSFKISSQNLSTDSINTSDTMKHDGILSHLNIVAESKLDTLLLIHKEENIRKGGIEGYRLQLFQGSKPEALKVKAKFISKYNSCKVYTPFISPDVYVRIGDFRDESEAVKLKYAIKKDFPHAIVIPSIIEYPELKN